MNFVLSSPAPARRNAAAFALLLAPLCCLLICSCGGSGGGGSAGSNLMFVNSASGETFTLSVSPSAFPAATTIIITPSTDFASAAPAGYLVGISEKKVVITETTSKFVESNSSPVTVTFSIPSGVGSGPFQIGTYDASTNTWKPFTNLDGSVQAPVSASAGGSISIQLSSLTSGELFALLTPTAGSGNDVPPPPPDVKVRS